MKSLTSPSCSSPLEYTSAASPLQQLRQQAQLGHLLLGLLGMALPEIEPHLGWAGCPGVQAQLGDEPVVSPGRRPEVAGGDPRHDADLRGGAVEAGLVVLHPARQQVLPQARVGAGQPPHYVCVGGPVQAPHVLHCCVPAAADLLGLQAVQAP